MVSVRPFHSGPNGKVNASDDDVLICEPGWLIHQIRRLRNGGNRLPTLEQRCRMTNRSTLSFNQEEDAMALKEFAGVYFEEALDEKTRQLVAMAAMAAAGCTS